MTLRAIILTTCVGLPIAVIGALGLAIDAAIGYPLPVANMARLEVE